jgi:hypothetical protein
MGGERRDAAVARSALSQGPLLPPSELARSPHAGTRPAHWKKQTLKDCDAQQRLDTNIFRQATRGYRSRRQRRCSPNGYTVR